MVITDYPKMREVLFGAIILLHLLSGCAPETSEKITINIQLREGEAYRMHVAINQTITQTIGETPQDLKQKMRMVYSITVKSVDSEGSALLETKYDSVYFFQESVLGIFEYDSEHPPSKIPPIAQSYAALPGRMFTLKLSREGKVTHVGGVDEMLDQMINQLDLPEENIRESLKKSMTAQFGDRAIRESFQSYWGVYPSGPVGVGESWQSREVVSSGYPIILENTWILTKVTRDDAVLTVHSNVMSNKEAGPVSMGNTLLRYEIEGKQEGEVFVSRKSGMISHSNITQIFSGTMTAKDTTGKYPEATWPISVASEIEQNLESIR